MPWPARPSRIRSTSVGPATGRAGFARSAVSGRSRVPSPAVRTSAPVGAERGGTGEATCYASSNNMSVSGLPCARRCSMKSDR